jgi:ABC-type phosphate/phosphonate transport system substrate-binding protein
MRLALFALLMALAGVVSAQGSPLVFAINEGVTYRVTPKEIRERYQGLTDLLSHELKRPVHVEPVEDYQRLRAGLDAQEYDLALVHPAHHALKSIADQKYVSLASVKGYTEYKATFLVKPGSPLKRPEDMKGQKIGAPDADSITAVLIRATLQDLGIDPQKTRFQNTRYQDAVPFLVEWGYVNVGATGSNAVVKEWTGKGYVTLLQSKPIAIKHVIASNKLSEAERQKITHLLLELDTTDAGRKILEPTSYKGFVAQNPQQLAMWWGWISGASRTAQ